MRRHLQRWRGLRTKRAARRRLRAFRSSLPLRRVEQSKLKERTGKRGPLNSVFVTVTTSHYLLLCCYLVGKQPSLSFYLHTYYCPTKMLNSQGMTFANNVKRNLISSRFLLLKFLSIEISFQQLVEVPQGRRSSPHFGRLLTLFQPDYAHSLSLSSHF